jgi:hypothetical protein
VLVKGLVEVCVIGGDGRPRRIPETVAETLKRFLSDA